MSLKKITAKKGKVYQLVIKNKKKIIIVLISLVVAGLLFGLAKIGFVASVNGQLINRFTVIKELEKQGGQKTLDVIILKALINQEANKKKITVSQADVDKETKKIETNIISQGLTLDQLLKQQGMTKESLVEEIKVQLMLNKLVGGDIAVSDKEIDEYLGSQSAQASSGSSQPSISREQAGAQIKQQKLQTKIQTYLADLKAKAKINYFIKY